MNPNKQNPDFLHIGKLLTDWFSENGRDFPFRKTQNPYNIWICEIIFQQTRIEQGIRHYNNFIRRFPNVKELANAQNDDVLLYWKGLGYYSRAINLHQAAKQIMEDYGGNFPAEYSEMLKLKGIGKYTAAAIASISFGKKIPAVDGNFYRVLSRLFADSFDISNPKAFPHFSDIALKMMPDENPGAFNEAVMDLGSEICKPRNPLCEMCPLQNHCRAFQQGGVHDFPVKTGKTKISDLSLRYYYICHKNNFLIRQRGKKDIWKNLYEFPVELINGQNFEEKDSTILKHKLTHRNLTITIDTVEIPETEEFKRYAADHNLEICNYQKSLLKSFPKPLQNFIELQHL